MTLDKNSESVQTGSGEATVTLKATVTPENATYPGVLWSADDENVTFTEVTPYDSSEVVVTIPQGTEGTITITARSVNVYEITDTCTITASVS